MAATLTLDPETIAKLLPPPTLTEPLREQLANLITVITAWIQERYPRDEYTPAHVAVVSMYAAALFQRRRERGTGGHILNQRAGTFGVGYDPGVKGVGLFDAAETAAMDEVFGLRKGRSVRLSVPDAVRFGNRLRQPTPGVTTTGGADVQSW